MCIKIPFVKFILVGILAGIFSFLGAVSLVVADSPPNTMTDIAWDEDLSTSGTQVTYAGVSAVEGAYNNARRQEEIQLGLPANTLGNLQLPSQAIWDVMTYAQKAIHIINSERVARHGIQAGVIGYPLTNIEVNLNNTSQSYADFLVSTNTFSHNEPHPLGSDPWARIDNTPVIGSCHEFLARGENLAAFWTSGSSIPMPVERAIYGWVYKNSSSSWGHRETVLLQDSDLSGNPWGYTDNFTTMGDEGFLGFGLAGDPTYDPYGWGWVNYGVVVVLMIVDPLDTGMGCNMPVPSVVSPNLRAMEASATDVTLTWTNETENCGYDVYHQMDPYGIYTPMVSGLAGLTHTESGIIGSASTNNYFYVEATSCVGGLTANSNKVGVFEFDMVVN